MNTSNTITTCYASGMNTNTTLTETQIKVLRALSIACDNRVTIKVDTHTVAQYADTNTLAAHKILELLVKKGYANRHMILNASVSGGAYKSGWSIKYRGLNNLKAGK
jgi:hypothetical protein